MDKREKQRLLFASLIGVCLIVYQFIRTLTTPAQSITPTHRYIMLGSSLFLELLGIAILISRNRLSSYLYNKKPEFREKMSLGFLQVSLLLLSLFCIIVPVLGAIALLLKG